MKYALAFVAFLLFVSSIAEMVSKESLEKERTKQTELILNARAKQDELILKDCKK